MISNAQKQDRSRSIAARPASFDARLMDYLPGMKVMARKYRNDRQERDDLVTDTIAKCLDNWEKFREDGGFYNWIWWQMRGIVGNQRDAAKHQPTYVWDRDGKIIDNRAVSPSQVDNLFLNEVLRNLATREGSVLFRRAMGDTLESISKDIGVSPERARQIEEKERARIVRMFA